LLQVKDRPCYMNSLMTESFFTMCVPCVGTQTNCNALNMLLPKQEDARVMPDSLGKQVMRKKFYRDFDL
jgi:hypothetical protein